MNALVAAICFQPTSRHRLVLTVSYNKKVSKESWF